ncbi:fumarate reductase subunit C [Roseospira marina]|uniref:Fumarate reductase subunit C n=1 Tax=Roseospira marina TaxID=140057 RepID=A0A5M6IIE1_9PROT|nr:fumarate reductase subunit C [Roseospira marina]KAA5607338.1 fumarate reductase subunit C [Roseospira marina]MBB4312499.1 fumarate reductase subunit C [Roseospira marina]MBB5085485.1 fumarate reductase subunit C [Roseospira marina]
MSRKPYVREVPKTTWYMRNGRYMRYMAREVTCVFLALYMAGLVIGLVRLMQGPEAWQSYLAGLSSPVAILFHLIAFGFACYHATSWFNVTPKAMRIPQGDGFVPGKTIVGAHYGLWGAASLVIIVLMGVL